MAGFTPRTVDTFIANNGCKTVVYGAPGAGKTALCATAPRPLLLSAEGGILTLKGTGVMMLPPIVRLADLIEQRNWCLQSNEAKSFDTICVDSVSEIAEVVLRNEKGNESNLMRAYGQTNDMVIHNLFRSFRDMPRKHFYATAKETVFVDTVTKARIFSPSMPGATMRSELPYFFDFVFRYVLINDPVSGSVWRGLQTFADGTTIAKSRAASLDKWEPPHLGAIFEKAMKG